MGKKSDPSSVPVRVDKTTLEALKPLKEVHGSWNKAITYFINKYSRKAWALPSDIYNTKSQALGESLKRAVQNGTDPSEKETPVQVVPEDVS